MLTKNEAILTLRSNQDILRRDFGVDKLVLFGSFARDQQTSESDMDLFVDMPAKMFLVLALKQYIENLVGTKVDVIRNHKGINALLLKEIQRDGINVFECA
ncbi:MAG: nucleotidyltransferase domain-containing protein [Paludibacteraceae bacterium]|nr:nucleotidyltransferase domain-containing protein [Paludibacteraceae bacterium]